MSNELILAISQEMIFLVGEVFTQTLQLIRLTNSMALWR